MLKYFKSSDASYPIGLPNSKRLFKITSGEYAGRIVAIIHNYDASAMVRSIEYAYADYPYADWSESNIVCNDNLDSPIDAAIDPNGNIYIAYTDQSTNYLVIRKMTFEGGAWTVGSQIVVYNGSLSVMPSIIIDSNGRLYISWSRYDGGSFYVSLKTSDDDGTTWGSGASDSGETLSSGAASLYSKLIISGAYVYSVYSFATTNILYRRILIGGTTWDAEVAIITSSGLDIDFDLSASNDGRLGLVFDDGELKFREFNGYQWSGVITLDSNGGAFPQVKYDKNIPYVLYLSQFGSGQSEIKMCRQIGGVFEAPVSLDSAKASFDNVTLYYSGSGIYADLTSASESSGAADIFHPDSLAMLKNSGDAVYFGLERQFNLIRIILSSAGTGGSLYWQYYDGVGWKSFTPVGGAYEMTDSEKTVQLWNDYLSIPSDWQKSDVNGANHYWIRAIVVSAFIAGPIGSQLTAIPDASGILIME